MYPWMMPGYQSYPEMLPNKEAKRLYKLLERQIRGKKEKKDEKKDEKKNGGLLKSPFTVVQWLVILCTFGPLLVPWYIVGVVNSWQNAQEMLKALIH